MNGDKKNIILKLSQDSKLLYLKAKNKLKIKPEIKSKILKLLSKNFYNEVK